MSIVNYFLNKDERSKVAKVHTETMDKLYKPQILKSIEKTTHYDGSHLNEKVFPLYDEDTKIVFKELDTVSAIFSEDDVDNSLYTMRYAVLNFASYKNPGGGFLDGSSAQEECLCHESNLYNVLSQKEEEFYIPNRSRLNNALYNDNLLYSKNIIFFKGNISISADVITCAAPNATAAKKYRNIPDKEISDAMYSRIDSVLMSAFLNRANVLILGAFGCGVFGNDIKEVARIFRKLLDTKYQKCFKKVIFAIPRLRDGDTSFIKFLNTFNSAETERHLDVERRDVYFKYTKG